VAVEEVRIWLRFGGRCGTFGIVQHNDPMITQYISPYKDGTRSIFQFFAHSRELWIITKENGRTTNRAEHKLADKFESVLESMEKVAADGGWEKHQQEAAS
jgi:hypothetical protein